MRLPWVGIGSLVLKVFTPSRDWHRTGNRHGVGRGCGGGHPRLAAGDHMNVLATDSTAARRVLTLDRTRR